MREALEFRSKGGVGLPLLALGGDLRSLWRPLFVVLSVLLFVPYTTGAMHWFFEQGYVPIQPVFYMLGLGGLVVATGTIKRPEFSATALLVLGVVGARAGDVVFLQRFAYPWAPKTMMFFLTSVVFMVVVSAVIAGMMRRVSKLPMLAVAVATVVVCAGVNLYEFAGFGDYSSVKGRAAGFLGDSNDSAIAITLMLGVFLSCSRSFWWGALMVGISGAGVLVTLSRSGMLVYVLMLVVWALLNLRQNFGRLAIIAAVGVPLASLGVGAMMAFSAKSAGVLGDENVEGRLAALFGGDIEKMASNERSRDLKEGLVGITKAPIAGLGTGAGTALYMPHNQLVAVWIDLGLVGVLLYGGLLVVLGWQCLACGFKGVLVLIPVVGYVPFSQTLLEIPTYWLAVLALTSITTVRVWSFSIFGKRGRVVRGNDGETGLVFEPAEAGGKR
ncbi:MAG: O-antigen ligase family protein [Verrucomicrobiales bacterium]|nr:O-antigen ligase family protein [Verrucomicrobiales bacterium]